MLATLAVMGQEKVNISAGLGAPELLNVGIRYQMGQSQLGLGAGIAPGSDEKAFSVGVDYFTMPSGQTVFPLGGPGMEGSGFITMPLRTNFKIQNCCYWCHE